MGEKRFHFYCPKSKVDSEEQTNFDHDVIIPTQGIYSRLHKSAIDLALTQEPHPENRADASLVNSYNSRLGFLISTFNHKHFEPLSPMNNIYNELGAGILIELHKTHFIVSNPETNRSLSYNYETSIASILEPLDTKIITPTLFAILEKLQCGQWESGSIICQVIDFRQTPEIEQRLKLSVGQEVFYLVLSRSRDKLSPEQYAEFESHTLLLAKPVICTDPSPDVARVNHIADYRQKVWQSHRTITKEDLSSPLDIFVPKERAISSKMAQLTEPIVIPEAINQVITNFNRNSS